MTDEPKAVPPSLTTSRKDADPLIDSFISLKGKKEQGLIASSIRRMRRTLDLADSPQSPCARPENIDQAA